MRAWPACAALLVLAGCSGDRASTAAERAKFEALRADPVLALRVPGGTPAEISGNAGRAGDFGTSARVFRRWDLAAATAPAFAAALRQAVAAGTRFTRLDCATTTWVAGGAKPVGGAVATVTVAMDAVEDEPTLLVSLTAAGGTDPAPPLPTAGPEVTGGCAAEVVAAVRPPGE